MKSEIIPETKEDREAKYWNRKWKLRDQHLHERVVLDGSDGEKEFDQELRRKVRGMSVLDVGCGLGEFTLLVGKSARTVVGVDSSRVALRLARANLAEGGRRNVRFRYGEARRLPFASESFDLVYSRRGPASEDRRSLAEAFRVLRSGGTFMEIAIGERDKRNIAEIFRRGQMLEFRGQVSTVKKRWLEEAGFKAATARDYLGTEVFRSMKDLVVRLRSAPIIPSFDPGRDRRPLEAVRKRCTTDRGIETPVHRVVLMGRK